MGLSPFRRRRARPPGRDGWVAVAVARHEPEAEMLADMLRQAGIPAFVRRHASADVAELLAAGLREVMVPGARAIEAHAIIDPMPPDARDAP